MGEITERIIRVAMSDDVLFCLRLLRAIFAVQSKSILC